MLCIDKGPGQFYEISAIQYLTMYLIIQDGSVTICGKLVTFESEFPLR